MDYEVESIKHITMLFLAFACNEKEKRWALQMGKQLLEKLYREREENEKRNRKTDCQKEKGWEKKAA